MEKLRKMEQFLQAFDAFMNDDSINTSITSGNTLKTSSNAKMV